MKFQPIKLVLSIKSDFFNSLKGLDLECGQTFV